MTNPLIEDILSSHLGRAAVETYLVSREGRPAAANLLRTVLEDIERMAQHCQLTEFTDHGLLHLRSLVVRVDTWTLSGGRGGLVNALTYEEAFLLLFGLLTHDIGMLAQSEADLDDGDKQRFAATFAHLPTWVRRTHVPRIRGILARILGQGFPEFVGSQLFELCCTLAMSHQSWPEEEAFGQVAELSEALGINAPRVRGLAGVLAVADLLDEDSGRCDSMTLFANKAGDLLNRAHWLRHILTENVLSVDSGAVRVKLRVPSNLQGRIPATLRALKNHLTLSELYNPVLAALGAEVQVQCDPDEYTLFEPVPSLPGLEMLLCQPDIHLLRTFMREALVRARDASEISGPLASSGARLVPIDLSAFDHAIGEGDRSDYEITFAAACREGPAARTEALSIMERAAWEAHFRGDFELVRDLARAVIREASRVAPSDGSDDSRSGCTWAPILLFHWTMGESDLHLIKHYSTPNGVSEEIIKKATASDELRWLPAISSVLIDLDEEAPWGLIVERMRGWLDDGRELSDEATLAWCDLFEALWSLGYLRKDVPESFWRSFEDLLLLEREQRPPHKRWLAELAWRSSVQSKCLAGFQRWETRRLVDWSRETLRLTPHPGRESLAHLWTSWFHSPGEEALTAAECARKANGPGSEYYGPALESAGLVERVDSWQYRRTMRFGRGKPDIAHTDPSYREIVACRSGLLRETLAPKEEGTVYFGGRGGSPLKPIQVLGERMALRRWYLEAWHTLVTTGVESALAKAYTMSLEGDDVRELVLYALADLPWEVYGSTSLKLMKRLLPTVETRVDTKSLQDLLEETARSPRRVANLDNPVVKMLSDALPHDMIEMLKQWTDELLQNPVHRLDFGKLEVWVDLLSHGDWDQGHWTRIEALITTAIDHIDDHSALKKIVQVCLYKAPWSAVEPWMHRILRRLSEATSEDQDWADEMKSALVNALLSRTDEQWRLSEGTKVLADLLRREDKRQSFILADLLTDGQSKGGHPEVARLLLESLEQLTRRAVERKSKSFSEYGIEYISAPFPPITDEQAGLAARCIAALWESEYPTTSEVVSGTRFAGLLLEGAQGSGRGALVESLIYAMAKPRTTLGFPSEEDSSYAAWTAVGRHSACIPSQYLERIHLGIAQRLMSLPTHVSWALARLSVEVYLRALDSVTRSSAQSTMLAIRARSASNPKHSARAFVALVERLGQSGDHNKWNEPFSQLLVEWACEAAMVSDSDLRRAVAKAISYLVERLPIEWHGPLAHVQQRLRSDLRLRVRQVLSTDQTSLS